MFRMANIHEMNQAPAPEELSEKVLEQATGGSPDDGLPHGVQLPPPREQLRGPGIIPNPGMPPAPPSLSHIHPKGFFPDD